MESVIALVLASLVEYYFNKALYDGFFSIISPINT